MNSYLHPKESFLVWRFKLQQEDTSSGALRDSDIFTIIREDDPILKECTSVNRTSQQQINSDYVFNSSRLAILPAKVDQGITWLVDINKAFPLVRVDHVTTHRHFTSPEFNQVLALTPSRGRSEEAHSDWLASSNQETMSFNRCWSELIQYVGSED